ncbi:unnamed protein product, partial [marine sediment metagenome]
MENIVDLLRLAKERALMKITKGQKGQALPIVLILLAIGGLLIVPTLNYASTSLKTHQVTETKAEELYSADSGVEDALYWLPQLWQSGGSAGPYSNWARSSYEINDRNVGVTVENVTSQTYKITSTATSTGGGSTTVECYAYPLDFSWLFDSAITSPGDITIKPGCNITGNVTYGGELNKSPGVTVNGDEIQGLPSEWPEADELSEFYWEDVKSLTPVPDGHTIDISSGNETAPYLIGPLYAQGDLDIAGSGVARLEGTTYVKGNLRAWPGCSINLNGQTIYAEGSITLQPGCTVSGSGCIIAEGDINFQPNMDSSEDDFLFLMSIYGKSWIKPTGTIYGSLAGDSDVDLQSGCTLT